MSIDFQAMPLADFLETYYFADRSVCVGSAQGYRIHVNRFAAWLERAPRLSDLTLQTVNDFLRSLAERYKNGTVRGARTTLRALWRRARIYEPLLESPTDLITVARWRDDRKVCTWSRGDVAALLTEAAKLTGHFRGKEDIGRAAFWRAYILTAYETGLRHSNITRIRAADISPDGKITTRNQSGRDRVASISENTRQAIMATHPENRPFVFDALDRSYFFKEFRKLIACAGLQGTGDSLRKAGAEADKVSPDPVELQAVFSRVPRVVPIDVAPLEVEQPAVRAPRRPQISRQSKWREVETPAGTPEPLYKYFARVYRPKKLLGKSPRTAAMYLQAFDRFGDYLARVPTLEDLNEDNVCGFLESRLLKGLAHHTVDKEGDKLKALANYAARKRHLPEFLDIPAINPAEILPTCWRREQVEQLFRACREARGRFGNTPRNVWWVAFHVVCLSTGERTEAMLSLTWDMLQGSTLSVPANIRKGKRKAKRYQLPPSVLEELEQLRRYTTGKIFAAPWKDVSASFYHHYTRLLKLAGLPTGRRFKPQCLRRTFASFLEAGGGDATEALGHSDRSVTKESYLDTSITLAGKEAASAIVWRELGLSSRPLALTHERQTEGAA